MKQISMISFDIFQTLVDVNARIPFIWSGILGDEYTQDKGKHGAHCMYQCLGPAMKKAACSDNFVPMRDVFIDSATNSLLLSGMALAPHTIADNLIKQHAQAPFYHEVQATLDRLSEMYPIILCSDSNRNMVNLLMGQIPHSQEFISEEIGAYKGDAQGRFFQKVLSMLDVPPETILHVGDSPSEILGAKNAGMQACWLNRGSHEWTEKIQPDYIIASLDELLTILTL